MKALLAKNPYVIAEAGVNHNGDYALACELIEKAAWAGDNAVKFQTFVASKLATGCAKNAAYQNERCPDKESHLAMLKSLELPYNWHNDLQQRAADCGIDFLSSAFDLESAQFLIDIGVPYLKIPSGEITNAALLWTLGNSKKPLIMSTGMSNMEEIAFALSIIAHSRCNSQEPKSREELDKYLNFSAGLDDVVLLHCNSQYPTALNDVNMLAMEKIGEFFRVPVGYSDHTKGKLVPIVAVANGAMVIEKHFTLDNGMAGPDHHMSMEPEAFKEMVKDMRSVKKILGSNVKRARGSEFSNINISRQRLVATQEIKLGETITHSSVTTSRASSVVFANNYYDVIGTKAKKGFLPGMPIEL